MNTMMKMMMSLILLLRVDSCGFDASFSSSFSSFVNDQSFLVHPTAIGKAGKS